MKKNLILSLLLGVVVIFTSCEKRFTEPEFEIPKYDKHAANHTIADIKAQYDNTGTAHVDSIAAPNDEPFIVRAVVISSDAGGNFYKSMVVQDHTGAIEIEINKTGIYPEYQVGQVVYIKCNGLCVDMYGKKVGGDMLGYYRMGWIYQNGVGQINANFLDNYLFRDGLPNINNVDMKIISQDNSYESEARVGMANDTSVCQLVEIRDCLFKASSFGKPLSGDAVVTEHKLK